MRCTMKKCFLICIVILIIITGVACEMSIENSIQPQENSIQPQSDHFPIEKNEDHLKEIYSRINNNSPYDELITKEIDINLFVEKFDPDPTISLFTDITLITEMDAEFGVECLRRTEVGTLYSVHKIKQGGLLYVFYRNHSYERTGEYEEIKHWYYVKEKLIYSDFSSVVNGTDIEKIADIDPITSVYIERANKYEKSYGATTFHYLEDGILMLSYKYMNERFKIVGQDYQKDFQINSAFTEAKVQLYDGHILPIDLLD